MKKIRVLLVDDHTVVRQGLRALLSDELDMEVVGEAETGRQAVQLAKQLQPDVVLMDIAMPVLNGLEATRQILRQVPGTKVLVLSSYSDDEYVQQMTEAGAAGYLAKQTAAREVVKAIREAQKGNAFFSPSIAKRLREHCREACVSGQPVKKRTDHLTTREAEVLQLIAEGRSHRQIATELCVSIKTVEKHRQQVMNKLNIHDIAGLTRHAISKGIIESSFAGHTPEGAHFEGKTSGGAPADFGPTPAGTEFKTEPAGRERGKAGKLDSVQFAAFAPREMEPRSLAILDIWAYLEKDARSVKALAKELGRDSLAGIKAGVKVQRHGVLTVKVTMETLQVQNPVETLDWNGKPANASFRIQIPEEPPQENAGEATISCQGIPIAKVLFVVRVGTKGGGREDTTTSVHIPQSAFASYARPDLPEVLARIQGMKKVMPEMDVFLDKLSIRSGEQWEERIREHVASKDVFFLFWSRSAARSEWVHREWSIALDDRGLGYIDPVPLESPQLAPPPEKLKALHFDDAYLDHIAAQKQMGSIPKSEPGEEAA